MCSSGFAMVDSIRRQYGDHRDYSEYTYEDQVTWELAIRLILDAVQSRAAIPFKSALDACGIPTDSIPHQEVLNRALANVGWQSVMVKTFIPAWDFMRLQAQRILPVTFQIRALSQLTYTPIPDLIHEVVGHLPMLQNRRYRQFIQRLGQVGSNLPMSRIDQSIYECQTQLAELKGRSHCSATKVEDLESKLNELTKQQQCNETPICLLGRFHWWTVEYGLIGASGQIYGAGLLSSAEEAHESDSTDKFRLSQGCLNYNYCITELQPQLFVADDWDHLDNELELFQRCI